MYISYRILDKNIAAFKIRCDLESLEGDSVIICVKPQQLSEQQTKLNYPIIEVCALLLRKLKVGEKSF